MVDDRSKDSVFGFIRQSRHKTHDTAIPMMIQYCCLNYYFINEYFTKCGDNLKISDDGKIVSKQRNLYGKIVSVYGNAMIDIDNISTSKYVWTIKIGGEETCYFGIDSSNKKWINGDFTDWDNPNAYYAYNMTAARYATNEDYLPYGEVCDDGDIVKMELDARNKTLKFYRNGTDLGCIPQTIISGKYHMALCFQYPRIRKKVVYEILDYEEQYK